jgi:hypothetical protein
MSVRRTREEGLSAFQRLALFHGTAVNAERALSMPEEEITYDFLVKNGVKALNIGTAGVRPVALQRMGATSPADLRRLGFSALWLVEPEFCAEANAAYGAQAVLEAFVVTASDAVMLAGTDAMATLNVPMQLLLEACAGAPTEAQAVLKQTPGQDALRGVHVRTLLDSGLRAPQLRLLGYGLAHMAQLSGQERNSIAKLGFAI